MSVTSDLMQSEFDTTPFIKRLSAFDWVWALVVLGGAIVAHQTFAQFMDGYEIGILYASAAGLIALGWGWKPMRGFSLVVGLLSLAAVTLYGGELARAETNFFLKFLISSQSAIMWMSALYVMATAAYFFALAVGSQFSGKVGTVLTWSASVMGTVGLMVRWRESYMMGTDIGHIPVSNLYEVFILFSVITALLYLTYERRYNNRAMGAFVLTVISAAVAFLLWYTFGREAHHIQPLVPALQSYWMKIHVPANFVGYGAFALAAMLGFALLGKHYSQNPSRQLLKILLAVTAVISAFIKALFVANAGGVGSLISLTGATSVIGYMVLVPILLAALIWIITRERVVAALPSEEVLDDIIYKVIALGFAFFTVATILGAMWAAEAWGGYWSWDPKETWALIVWLNYAAWLHLRLTKGWRGRPLAWWAIVGLFVTLFAFVGVNMFLSGLHSYGSL